MKTILIFSLLFFVTLFSLNSLSSSPSVIDVFGKSVVSSRCGDLYAFEAQVYGMKCVLTTNVETYLQLVFPESGIKVYQLDYLRHKKKQNYISYSCELCLTEVGKYQAVYFIVDCNGNKIFDPHIYEFAVFTDPNLSSTELK